MEAANAIALLRDLHDEASGLPHSASSAEFSSWDHRTRSVLAGALGEEHHITAEFVSMSWTPGIYMSGDREAFPSAFRAAMPRALGLFDAAIFELEHLSAMAASDTAGFDPELWEHVGGDALAEEWGKVASQTSIFTEDRIRKWAGRSPEEVGEKLMTAVFGDRGEYRLGLTDGEKQGWHRLAMGISMALRNADAHRIQSRADHKRYAMGVLGASSLLLTQMRFEHGNRFQDISPAGPESSTDSNAGGSGEPDWKA
jgi:hypothetical protein